MSTRHRKRTIVPDLFGIFLSGMGMSVFLIPMAAYGPTAAGIVKVVLTTFYAIWLASDVVRMVKG